MSNINSYLSVTAAVFAVYLLLALLGSRERNDAAPHRARKLRRWLREWANGMHSRRKFY